MLSTAMKYAKITAIRTLKRDIIIPNDRISPAI